MAVIIPSTITPSDAASVFRSGPAPRRGRTSSRPLPCPFTIAIDTREQAPYTFDTLHADSNQSYRPFIIDTQRTTLRQGDYSIINHESRIAIERKSKQDLFGTLSAGRERFEAELDRLSENVTWSFVVVEAERSEIIDNPPEFSNLLPKTVFRSVMAWQMRHPSIHWWFCRNRRDAERVTFRLLERYWKEFTKAEQQEAAEKSTDPPT